MEKTFENAAAIVREFYRAGQAGEFEIVKSLLAQEVVLTEPATLPYGGVHRGPEAVIAAAQDLYIHHLRFSKFELRYVLCEGENAVARIDFSATAQTSGKTIESSAMEGFVVRNNKIVEIQPYHYDTIEMLQTLSLD